MQKLWNGAGVARARSDDVMSRGAAGAAGGGGGSKADDGDGDGDGDDDRRSDGCAAVSSAVRRAARARSSISSRLFSGAPCSCAGQQRSKIAQAMT
jgi:hypothetical protein